MVEIQAAEGGDDAKEFADELADGYFRWLRDHEPEPVARTDGYTAFLIGPAQGALFASEVGLHCIQRVPANERRGRMQTSYARVTMSPLARSDSRPLDPREVEITTQRGHGKGGQHQNKTDSAVRAVHRPTGLAVFINGRSQLANKETALKVLAQRVQEHVRRQSAQGAEAWKRAQASAQAKIRTYNLAENRAVDHRTGMKVFAADRVLRGEFWRLSGKTPDSRAK